MRNIMSWETIDNLQRQVTLTKSHSALKTLHNGEVIAGYQAPSLKERFDKAKESAKKAAVILLKEDKSIDYSVFDQFEKEKLVYLNKKRWADKLAMVLNAIVSLLGVGLVGALAMVAVLPVIGITLSVPVAIGVLIVTTLLGGYTEGFVYFEYVQKFCRQLFVNFFDGIDNKILNREAYKYKNYKKRDRHALNDHERAEILKEYNIEGNIKKTLVVLSFLVSIAAGVGYMGLLFTEISFFLTVNGLIAAVPALVFVPWVLAAIVAPAYAIVMCGMLYKAIKDNYLVKIKNHIVDLFSYKKANEKHKEAAEDRGETDIKDLSYGWHVFTYLWKSALVLLVLSFSAVAVVATAGLWLETSVNFFAATVGLAEKAADIIGKVIWGIYLATTLWFCADKSLKTANSVAHLPEHIKDSFKDAFSSPKKFFSAMCNWTLMIFHIAGNAAVAALGSVAKILKSALSKVAQQGIAAAADAGSEFFIDAGDAAGINDHHHHSSYAKFGLGQLYTEKEKHDHDHHAHSHGNIVKTCIKGASVVRAGAKKMGEGLGMFEAPVKVKPKPLHAFGLSARSST